MNCSKSAWRGKAVIAFVDLLGFSQRIIETWGRPGDALSQLFSMRDSVNAISKYSFYFEELPNPEAFPEVSLFSDSLLVIARPQPSRVRAYMTPSFTAAVARVGDIIRVAAESGFGVRGGLEFGDVWWDGKELIGPAFLTAYALEQRASSARVLIGPAALRAVAEEKILLPLMNDLTYRADDDLRCVRPSLGSEQAIAKVSTSSPDYASKYDEVLRNCAHPTGGKLGARISHLLSSAKSAEELLKRSLR